MNKNNSRIECITYEDETYSLIIRDKYHNEGIEFFTHSNFSQQLGYMSHKSGHKIQPHFHNYAPREVEYTQEVLLVKYGKVRVEFYNKKNEFFKSILLDKGDLILLAKGGHGFVFEEDSALIEIKQGPYMGNEDKTRF